VGEEQERERDHEDDGRQDEAEPADQRT